MLKSLPSSTKITAVKVKQAYRIKIDLEAQSYLHFHDFKTLFDTVSVAKKIISTNQINLDIWKLIQADDEVIDKYLFREGEENNPKFKAHLWAGLDTYCTMWASGGLGLKYSLFNLNFNKDICTMCLKNITKR